MKSMKKIFKFATAPMILSMLLSACGETDGGETHSRRSTAQWIRP